MTKRLWEIKHPYYCNHGNYFARESVGTEYKRWGDFELDNRDSDFDLNLIFRFDWTEENDNGDSTYNGDENYRNGILSIYWMGQRKGLYRYSTVEVCRADEIAVMAFLRPRWDYMRELWEGLSDWEPLETTPL